MIERKNFIDLTKSKQQHGLSHHPLYNVWREMRRRCDNPKHKWYSEYGGRGIIVCNEWNSSFIKFYNDVINIYEKGKFLDRIDNDKNYELSNIRFSTISESNTNKRVNGKMPSGCTLSRVKYWRARIKVENVEYHIGNFKTKEEGEIAYKEVHKEWYGF